MRVVLLAFLFCQFIITVAQSQRIDSLLAVDKDEVGFDQAKRNYQTAINLSIRKKDLRNAGLAEYKLAQLLDEIAENDSSRLHFFKALEYFSLVRDSAYISKTYRLIGNNYNQDGLFDSATVFVVKSLDIAKRLGIHSDLSLSYNSLANIYSAIQQYPKAIEFYEKALEKDIDQEHLPTIYSNMALCYTYMGEYDLARESMISADRACEMKPGNDCEMIVQSKMVMVYLKSNQLDSAAKYCKILIEKLESEGLKEELVVKYNQLGMINVMLQKYDSAQMYYEKCLAIARDIKFDRTHLILANLALVAQRMGNFQLAYAYLFHHIEMRDSLDLVKADKRFEDLLVKYQAVEKEQQIARLEKEQLTQKVIVIIGCIVLIALVVLLIIYRQKIKATRLVAEKIKEINERKTRALKQENELKQIKARIEGQEKERLRIAKELHDSIAGNLAGIKLGLSRISENYSDDQAINQIKSNIDQTYNEVRSISTNLSPLKTSDFTFLEMVKRYVEGMSHLHGFELEFDDNTTSDLLSLTDELKLELYRVFQELVNNIVKHSNATLVEISINELEDQLNVIIEDDGCGFDEKQITEGMGLKNIASRIAILKGEFHIDSVPGRGTITNIDIPFKENNMQYA